MLAAVVDALKPVITTTLPGGRARTRTFVVDSSIRALVNALSVGSAPASRIADDCTPSAAGAMDSQTDR